MKKIITMTILVLSSMLAYAQTSGEVVVMNKAMFIKNVFDYEKSQDWKYKGNKPAIIDLYADWCGRTPQGGSHYEGTGQRVCRQNHYLQGQCG